MKNLSHFLAGVMFVGLGLLLMLLFDAVPQ